MKIAMVASEANPVAKTGGLADVVYSLSKELTIMGEEVIIILPFYGNIKGTLKTPVDLVCEFDVHMSWRCQKCQVYRTYIDGIAYYLLGNDYYFNRGHFYGDFDDGERFAFFTLASKQLFSCINFKPDVIHVHDWQPGLLPCIIKEEKPVQKIFKDTKFVLTIHNPAFQGLFGRDMLGEFYNMSPEVYDNGNVEFSGNLSTLKAAIVYCDKITTVSPTHREEMLTLDGSKGLSSVIEYRQHDFCGFLNGLDTLVYDPKTDEKIAKNYDGRSYKSGKRANKEALLKAFNLPNKDAPLFVLVSRLTWQKGMDLVVPACYEIINRGGNVIILGSGEYEIEQQFERMRGSFPKQVGIYIGFNEDLSHLVYAGGDFFMMPSLFEPCGIGQMMAQRYGTPPIVRRTGGLKDSVIGYNNDNLDIANGFSFDDYGVKAFINTCIYALDVYNNKSDVFNHLIRNAMKVDNSWRKSAKLYLGLYESIVGGK